MSWELAFDGGVEDVLVTAHGWATVEGLQAMTTSWMADPRFARGSTIILDYRDLDWSAMSAGDLRRRAKDIAGYELPAPETRVVFVIDGTLERGLFRMIEAFADEDGGVWFDWFVVSTLVDAHHARLR